MMYRRLVALCIIVFSIPFGVVYGIKTGEVEIGHSGIYDGVVKISRDLEGNLLFQDSQVTSPVLLKDLGQGVEDHHELQGLSGDDHVQYLTSERHGQTHVASFNDALALSPDVGNNTSLGTHVQDSDIHLQRAEAEQISGDWVFSGTPQFYAPIHFSNNGGTGYQALEFEAGEEDALIAWNATAEGFELNKPISAPVGEFALGKSTEMEVIESISGRDASGTPVAVIEGFSQIEGIQAQNLMDKSADEDINGQWDFLKNMRVTQTLSSLSSYLWALTAELTTTSNDTENRTGLNRMGLMAVSHFSNEGSGEVTHSWNVGVQGEARSTGKSTSGESINDFGVLGKASSESALTNVIGVAGFGDLYSANRARIGVYGGLDSSIMGDPGSLPTGEWAGYFAGNVHVTGILSGDGIQKGQVVTVAKSGGDYTSVQSAIDSITDSGATKPYVILVYPGIYSETVMLNKSYVDLVGVSRDACIITRNFSQAGAASFGDGTLNCNSNNLIANLTIRNTGAAPDATISLYLGSGTKYFRNCVFSGAGRDIVTIGGGTNYFDDCRMVNTEAAHVIWIYNGDTIFTDCDIKSYGTVVQFTTLAYTKSAEFYNCSMKCTGTGYIFDLVHGNNTLTVDNIIVETGGGGNLFYNTVGTINLGRVVGEDNNAGTFTMLKNADAAFESLNVGTATGAVTGDAKMSGYISTAGNELLAHDIIRHTVTADEATAGLFTEAWNEATVAKMVSIDLGLSDISAGKFRDRSNGGTLNSSYDGSDIAVTEGMAWAANDIVTIYIVYEK